MRRVTSQRVAKHDNYDIVGQRSPCKSVRLWSSTDVVRKGNQLASAHMIFNYIIALKWHSCAYRLLRMLVIRKRKQKRRILTEKYIMFTYEFFTHLQDKLCFT